MTQLVSWLSLRPEPPPPPDTYPEKLFHYLQEGVSYIQQVPAQSVAATLLTALLSIILFMSWSSRFGGWGGRFSPFGRASPNASTEVSDADFSYITAEDLARTRGQGHGADSTAGPDVLVLKHGRVSYPIHFPGASIDMGELLIGDIRNAAAGKLGLSTHEASRIKLLYRGRNLKDNDRCARDEGLRSDTESELMCVVGEQLSKAESSESDGEADSASAPDGGSGKKRKPRKRKSKSKSKAGSGTATPTGSDRYANPNPDATYLPHAAAPPRPTSSSHAAPQNVQTPLQKLETLASTLHTKFVPECVMFMTNPPSESTKRDFEHKRLTETIMAQILLKADAIEPEGDPIVRQSRKDLVREAQGMLNKLDEVVQQK